MARKLIIVGLVLGALILVLGVLSTSTLAATGPGVNQDPQPQSPQTPNALPVFEARLTGSEETPNPISTSATGRAVMVLDQNLSTVYYRVMVSNITGITGADIRIGQPGDSGDVVFPLYSGSGAFDPDNPISGTLTLSPLQVTELIIGNYYVNVETSGFPTGEIRGQLHLTIPPMHFNALMSGAEEVPPVDTPATGVGSFTLNATLEELTYQISVSDITSITLAHLHTGWPGEAGPPVVPIYTGTVPFDPSNPISGTVTINGQNLLDLLTGYLYANVHTSAHPTGEIRGQVTSGYYAFEAGLAGENEVPPITTAATGRAVMVLDKDLTTLYYRVSVTDLISPTAAHIHIGAPGENGPIVFPLYNGSGPFDENHPISGTITLTDTDQVNTLLAGNYYVNVHTESYPNGAIRGQLQPFTPEKRYSARLTGTEEVPPVDTLASGTAEFTLGEGLDRLRYDVRVMNISNIILAHIHAGLPGQVGPPVIPLFAGAGTFDPEHPLVGAADLSPQNLLDLLTGFLYVNVHTTEHPNGEIRGQVQENLGTTLFLPMLFKP